MHTKLLLKLLLAALVTANAAGCATRDHRDAAWDPRPGTALFEQIPNWTTQPCQKFCPSGK
jgi:hypothetical protein